MRLFTFGNVFYQYDPPAHPPSPVSNVEITLKHNNNPLPQNYFNNIVRRENEEAEPFVIAVKSIINCLSQIIFAPDCRF